MLYVKQIKYPEQTLIFAPSFNLDMFPIIFMHGDTNPEIVDIKDKGYGGEVANCKFWARCQTIIISREPETVRA